MALLELRHVEKNYGRFKALQDINLSVDNKSIFGLLGPNGAGKTSMIRIVTNITGADSGEVLLNNEPLREDHSSIIGYMPEERGLYKKMKVWEQLVYLARLKGLSYNDARTKVYYWMDRLNIKDWWGKRIEELSKGMGQKIQFISTVVHDPKLIILDEPFSGLDPINANLIQNEIHDLKEKGATVIFSTHRMEQVEEICENIALIDKGKIILSGKVTDIKNQFKENVFKVEFEGTAPELREEYFPIEHRNAHSLLLKMNNGATLRDLLKTLADQDSHVTSFREILPSLNEIFIQQVTAAKAHA
ncbi:MAG TPA: ATP-binding cassette domain-containing protein [Chitinophagales bacterium]|nr:ATP-binding cassette domain-containing protein [Chitinophagales bacterium]